MQFLQPLMLAALPLVALPILIHLIHQRRHRTRRWAAMQFLFQAKRMTKGMARLRHVLIMLLRMAVVAGVILAISRPLATGMLGLAGGVADTTIILLDRSASMEQQDLATGQSKRSTAIRRVSELIESLGESIHVVLIESTTNQPIEMEAIESLPELPEVAQTSTSANIPAMLQAACQYIAANQTGRTDVWICSDQREEDWNPDSSAWTILRSEFNEMEGVRFHVLSFADLPRENISVRVEDVKLRYADSTRQLVMDVHLQRTSQRMDRLRVPIEFIINGNRSVVTVDMPESEFTLQGHVIPLDSTVTEGWGRVDLPQDENPIDSSCYFVFAEAPVQRSVIVSDDAAVADFLQLAMLAPANPQLQYSAEIVSPEQAREIDWEETALVIWHAPIPDQDETVGRQLKNFAQSGRSVVFIPSEEISGNTFFGMGWSQWKDAASDSPIHLASWRRQSDLLGHTREGSALPVDELRATRYCAINGKGTVLARFEGGDPLLVRKDKEGGGAYFCCTVPAPRYSNLARNGVVIYVMLHRALSEGTKTLGRAQRLTAGAIEPSFANRWSVLSAPSKDSTTSVRTLHAGAYKTDDGTLLALNRPFREDDLRLVADEELEQLFSGLDYHTIAGQLGKTTDLVNEIWQAFLVLMGLALIGEALLCIPPGKKNEEQGYDQ